MQRSFPQGLKPNPSKAATSELKLRPPKRCGLLRELVRLRRGGALVWLSECAPRERKRVREEGYGFFDAADFASRR
jgi:hypothetical protein